MRTSNANRRVLIPYRHERKLKAYVDALAAAGMDPAPAYVGEAVSFDGAAGLLLMGGTDVNPTLYGEEARAETDEPDDQRDQAELRLIEEAIRNDVPIFAICRGLQILNVYHGGTLIQHLAAGAHDAETQDKGAHAHEIEIEADTQLARIAGSTRLPVNSRHHQAVKQMGKGLRVSARSAGDAVIEGLERADRTFVVGVQWHPEDQVSRDSEQLNLFRAFAEALG